MEGAKERERPSSHCHHFCRLSNLAILGCVLLAWETLAEPKEARWFFSAIELSVTNQRLLLAAILTILATVITLRHSPRFSSES